MVETKKPKTKPKPKTKSKSKPTQKKEKPKPIPKQKKEKPKPVLKPKERKVIVEITEPEKEKEIYSDKVKHLLYKIKDQNNYNDTGIRFAWRQ